MSVARCPDAAWGFHGPADASGRCPYCRAKYTSAMPRPTIVDEAILSVEYRRHYDPDFGVDDRDT